jgi:DNA-directed RNA polymerase subunit RPC12/RpoP
MTDKKIATWLPINQEIPGCQAWACSNCGLKEVRLSTEGPPLGECRCQMLPEFFKRVSIFGKEDGRYECGRCGAIFIATADRPWPPLKCQNCKDWINGKPPAPPAPPAPSCLRCRFWEKLYLEDQEPKYRSGECRFDPPTMQPQRVYQSREDSSMVENGAEWPVTQHDGWCGKFEPSPKETP